MEEKTVGPLQRFWGNYIVIGLFLAFALALIIATVVKAAPTQPTGLTAVVTSTQSLGLTWTSGVNDSGEYWVLRYSLDGTTIQSTVTTTPTSTKDYVFYDLATNTLHYLAVAASDFQAQTSTFSTTTAYTAAAIPNAPNAVVPTSNPQQLSITIDATTINENPTAVTTFIVRTISGGVTKYLEENGTWGSATTTLTYNKLGGGAATTTYGLATNTLYSIDVAAVNGDSTATTTYGAAVQAYTAAAIPGAPAVVTSTSPNVLDITIDATTLNSNPTTDVTLLIVKDTGSDVKYLQSNGTWGIATATLTYAQLGSGLVTSTTGLIANSLHVISVAAVNGDSTATTTYGPTAETYTVADVPTGTALNSSAAPKQVIVTWNGNATEYFVINNTLSTNSGWIGSATFTNTGLVCGTTYAYQVKGRNALGVETAYANSVSVSTQLCPASSPGLSGGGGGGVTITPTPTPTTVVTIPTTTPETSVTAPLTTTPDTSVTAPTTGGTATAPIAPTATETRFTFTRALTIGSRGSDVSNLQTILKELGFFTYPQITGYFGSISKNAVQLYQKARQLAASGVVDNPTRDALASEEKNKIQKTVSVVKPNVAFTRLLRVGSTGTDVRALQEILRDLGYFTHPTITGYYGGVTRDAVIKFQRAKGLAPYPGWVGPGTRDALNSL